MYLLAAGLNHLVVHRYAWMLLTELRKHLQVYLTCNHSNKQTLDLSLDKTPLALTLIRCNVFSSIPTSPVYKHIIASIMNSAVVWMDISKKKRKVH